MNELLHVRKVPICNLEWYQEWWTSPKTSLKDMVSTNSILVKAGFRNLNEMVASQAVVMEVTQSQGPPWHEQFSFPIRSIGAIGGKTCKTMVLPGFCKIECGGDSGSAPPCYRGLILLGPVCRADGTPAQLCILIEIAHTRTYKQ